MPRFLCLYWRYLGVTAWLGLLRLFGSKVVPATISIPGNLGSKVPVLLFAASENPTHIARAYALGTGTDHQLAPNNELRAFDRAGKPATSAQPQIDRPPCCGDPLERDR